MFAYCGNNPVNRKDSLGNAWDTVFDVVSLAFSVAEVAANPADLWAWASLSGDLVDVLLPFVGGIGETVRGVKAAGYADEVADAIGSIATTGSAARKGKAGELLAGITSNRGKQAIPVNGRIRIPDFIGDTELIEVKNVAKLTNTQQLKDFATIAEGRGLSKVLLVRPTTKVSKSVIDAGWEVRTLW